MKKYLFLLLAVAALSLCSCKPVNNPAGDKTVFVTIEPLRYFVEQIAGPEWTVQTMVPAGSSPETYDPTPVQLVQFSNCRAFFAVGYLGFEEQWLDNLKENAPHVVFYTTGDNVPLLEGHHHHHEGEKDEEGVDPHIWTTPKNALVMAKNICTAFSKMDPAHADDYLHNLVELEKTIMQTDSAIRQQCVQGVQPAFVIYHPSLTYFAQDYGLEQISMEEGGKEPSPAQLKHLVQQCREKGAHTIFIQSEFNTQNAETLAKEIGGKLVPINPLSYDWNGEMLRIIQALKP
ncbi:MAG: zinc ABC transporter substrate-binding protein [Bacteroidaceae bacterium]|nr:zinc ABC transporter substrate-binding protein [Bacteroidaceae bacterium]